MSEWFSASLSFRKEDIGFLKSITRKRKWTLYTATSIYRRSKPDSKFLRIFMFLFQKLWRYLLSWVALRNEIWNTTLHLLIEMLIYRKSKVSKILWYLNVYIYLSMILICWEKNDRKTISPAVNQFTHKTFRMFILMHFNVQNRIS